MSHRPTSSVPFLGVAGAADWIAERGIASILGALTDHVAADLARWSEFDKAPRVAAHSPVGVIELMPTSDGVRYAFKYVNGHPGNPLRGLQTVTAFGVLADVESGYPIFVSEMTLLTALRTAATSALAARTLARPDASTMALIGAGAQSEFQSLAFREVLGIERLRVWDIDPAAMAKLRGHLEPRGFEIHLATSAADAVVGADIITTCTADKSYATVLTDDLVAPGVHVNAIGGDCPGKTELEAAILDRAAVFVEFEPQSRIEGELQQMPADFVVTELAEVLGGRAPGRTSREQITVFDSVGFAVEDFSVLTFVHSEVSGTRFVAPLDLITDPGDPKDLFGLVAPAVVATGMVEVG